MGKDDAQCALLSLSASTARARPLRNWSATQRTTLAVRLSAVLDAWSRDWSPSAPARPVQVEFVDSEPKPRRVGDGAGSFDSPEPGARWDFARQAGSIMRAAPQALSSREPALEAINAIREQLFGSAMTGVDAAEPVIARGVCHAAWQDWLQRIEDAIGCKLDHAVTDADGRSANAWEGNLHLRWPWCAGSWHLHLSHAVVEYLVGSEKPVQAVAQPAPSGTAPKAGLQQALAAQRLDVGVWLGGAQLSLGQLQDLRLGDIVRLTHALDAPAHVLTSDDKPVCDGWLGQLDGSIAVELATSHRTNNPSPHTYPHQGEAR